ncbi:MAG: hypothetical protein CL915_03860 [Deltaproteobacteria bacterium]|nr:hypothetical protein [Deltaproteobacteria bacterium]
MIADETIRTLPLEIYFAVSSCRFLPASASGVIPLAMSVGMFLLVERSACSVDNRFLDRSSKHWIIYHLSQRSGGP